MTEQYYRVMTASGKIMELPQNQITSSDNILEQVSKPVVESTFDISRLVAHAQVPNVTKEHLRVLEKSGTFETLPTPRTRPTTQDPIPEGDKTTPQEDFDKGLYGTVRDSTEWIPFVRDITAYFDEVINLKYAQKREEDQRLREAERIAAEQKETQLLDPEYNPIYDPFQRAGIGFDSSGRAVFGPLNPQLPIPNTSTFQPTISIGGISGLGGEGGMFGDFENIAMYGAVGLVAIAAIMLLK